MSKEKGYFKDIDKNTQEHQEMCIWFTDRQNVENFVWICLHDAVVDLKITLEKPVKSKTGFLYGFADVHLSYENDQGKQEGVLIEVKSSLSDFGATLRQIRTYQEYLGNITKTCLVSSDLENDDHEKTEKFFWNQAIYYTTFETIKTEIEEALDNKIIRVPAGEKRSAELLGVWFSKENWSLIFDLRYNKKYKGCEAGSLVHSGNYRDHQEEFWALADNLGLEIDKKNPTTIHEGRISIPCLVDLSYHLGEFYLEEVVEKMYINEQAIELRT